VSRSGKLLTYYAISNALIYLYVLFRCPFDAGYAVSVCISALIVVLLFRGSRGAWLLAFLNSALALGCAVVAFNEVAGVYVAEWLAVTALFATQVGLLLASEVREFVRITTHERAIRSGRSW
jgi:hypothetical protein